MEIKEFTGFFDKKKKDVKKIKADKAKIKKEDKAKDIKKTKAEE